MEGPTPALRRELPVRHPEDTGEHELLHTPTVRPGHQVRPAFLVTYQR